jgi:hypothetical protein
LAASNPLSFVTMCFFVTQGLTPMLVSSPFVIKPSCWAVNHSLTTNRAAPAALISDRVGNDGAHDLFKDFSGFSGAGFAPEPGRGQLDSDFWSISGTSADVALGGVGTSVDAARGATTGGVSPGGVHGPTQAGDIALMAQPTGGDFTPVAITLRLVNTDDVALSNVTVPYAQLINNDQPAPKPRTSRLA